MSDLAIKVENLGKSYLVGHKAAPRERYTTLRDVVAQNARGLARKTRDMLAGRPIVQGDEVEEFWALQDVSFEVRQGDRVGIIGRNGAGKSTLLKILSRITEPTQGRVTINGRVASLLEVGTGFHPELTGRENVFLNGAILGMTRREIQRKFDEIIDFAEVERFLDTPVKRYSSGMYVRLAFAVAAHLEPEILVVDEVLAVGDVQFQKKCLGKMEAVARQGRTVLFVSHNMPAVKALCDRGILLSKGACVFDGSASMAVKAYLDDLQTEAQAAIVDRKDRTGNGDLMFTGFEILDEDLKPIRHAYSGQKVLFAFSFETGTDQPPRNVAVEIGVHGDMDQNLFHLSSRTVNYEIESLPPKGRIVCAIESLPLMPGRYNLNIFGTANGQVADWVKNAASFEVVPSDFFGTGRLPPPSQGAYLVRHGWSVIQ